MFKKIFREVGAFVFKRYRDVSMYILEFGEKCEDENRTIEFIRNGCLHKMEMKAVETNDSVHIGDVYLKMSRANGEIVEMVLDDKGIMRYVEGSVNLATGEVEIAMDTKTDDQKQIDGIIKLFINNHVLCDKLIKGSKSTWNTI